MFHSDQKDALALKRDRILKSVGPANHSDAGSTESKRPRKRNHEKTVVGTHIFYKNHSELVEAKTCHCQSIPVLA